LRSRYGASADDREPVLAIGDAIRYDEAVMTATELEIEPWPAELDAADVTDAADGGDRGAAAPVEAARSEREWPAPFPRRRRRRASAPDSSQQTPPADGVPFE